MSSGPPFTILSTCKGGGYKYCRTNPPHPRANSKGLYPLHRVLVENRLGRLLAPGEVVHHDDEDKANDGEQNLLLKTRSEHARLHARTVAPIACVCAVCAAPFKVKPSEYRARTKRGQTGLLACSRSCGAVLGAPARAT